MNIAVCFFIFYSILFIPPLGANTKSPALGRQQTMVLTQQRQVSPRKQRYFFVIAGACNSTRNTSEMWAHMRMSLRNFNRHFGTMTSITFIAVQIYDLRDVSHKDQARTIQNCLLPQCYALAKLARAAR